MKNNDGSRMKTERRSSTLKNMDDQNPFKKRTLFNVLSFSHDFSSPLDTNGLSRRRRVCVWGGGAFRVREFVRTAVF